MGFSVYLDSMNVRLKGSSATLDSLKLFEARDSVGVPVYTVTNTPESIGTTYTTYSYSFGSGYQLPGYKELLYMYVNGATTIARIRIKLSFR